MHTIEDHEINRHLAARLRLVKEFRAYGTKLAVDLDYFASGLPDEEALYGLWEYVQELADRSRSSRGPTAACDALNQVICARNNYDLEVRSQGSIPLDRDLVAIAKMRQRREIIALFDRRLVDPQRGPALLLALWLGAVGEELARDPDREVESPSVKIKGKWSVLGDSESALRCLAEDPVAFAAVARRALDRHKMRDWLRPLRDLNTNPTRPRFKALVKHQKVYRPALRREARRQFGGSLAVTWRSQVAADPEKIKAVARGALEFLKLGSRASGPPRDLAQDMYVTRLCEVYQTFTGKAVSYSTATSASRSRPEGCRYGPTLTFVELGLRLIDPGASNNQAKACIDWYRRRSADS